MTAAESASASRPAAEADDTSVTEAVCAMFTEVLETPVRPQDEIQHLNSIHSLKLMRLITKIEDHYSVTLQDDSFFQASTVADVIRIVEAALETRT